MKAKIHFFILLPIFFLGLSRLQAGELKKPTFASQKIELVSKRNGKAISLKVEIADTPARWEYGLMKRNKLEDGNGMLFIFNDEQVRQFWMKNTFIDLSIAYFDKAGELINIRDMQKVSSELETNLPTYPSDTPAKYALEVPKGWFLKFKIGPGDKLVLK